MVGDRCMIPPGQFSLFLAYPESVFRGCGTGLIGRLGVWSIYLAGVHADFGPDVLSMHGQMVEVLDLIMRVDTKISLPGEANEGSGGGCIFKVRTYVAGPLNHI